MNLLLFGATGMVGGGVLLECLDDPAVHSVLVVGRSPCGVHHPKLAERLLPDLFDVASLAPEFSGKDACLFCLGVSAVGMGEDAYRRVTQDLTLEVARVVLRESPGAAFLYVSGQGTDSSERGRAMWARVKGRTENALLEMGFRGAYMFRPGFIQPMRGVRSSTGWYQAFYTLLGPLIPLLRRLAPGSVTTTEKVGRAMLRVAAVGHPLPILETADINRVADA